MSTVFVGLSGGVDSAVSAVLMKEAGHTVVGAYIKIWSPEFLECTWRQDRIDAKRVAVHLGIPFLEIDLSAEYRARVIDDMIQNYQHGITPNPDVLCNSAIKFGTFSKWAFENGADYVATGHYAQNIKKDSTFELKKGVDSKKDQSYFLYRLTQDNLARSLFPVGAQEKKVVREKAVAAQLPNALRPDSQGLCFVGDVTLKDFLGRFISLTAGPLINEAGEIIGSHDGSALYTKGQRHGFTLFPKTLPGPYFVFKTDTSHNAVYVSHEKERAMTQSAKLTDIHWISPITDFTNVTAVARYHAKPVPVTFSDTTITVSKDALQIFSPGQSVVLYREDVCLGGGLIAE